MSEPSRCPVCEGRGLVPAGFYETGPFSSGNVLVAPEACRTCHGSGALRANGAPVRDNRTLREKMRG